jgi:hypothetical protein
VNEKLRAALERYDAQGYELQLLTPDSCAILRRRDDWISLRLVDDHVRTSRMIPVRSGWSRLARPLVLVLVLLGVTATVVSTGVAETEPPQSLANSPTATAGLTGRLDTGTLLMGGVPPGGGFGLLVFGGGTDEQLVRASGCPPPTAAFWATDDAGQFVGFVPGAGLDTVNAQWRARFRNGIPIGTPLLGQCIPPLLAQPLPVPTARATPAQ